METKNANKGKRSRNHSAAKSAVDPELEAEIFFAKENGVQPPRMLASETVKTLADTFIDEQLIDKNLRKNLKNSRAERKARARGVSGCSSKKGSGELDGGCWDIDSQEGDKSGTDIEDDYLDYCYKYSEDEIRAIVGDYCANGHVEDALDSLEKFCITGDTVFRMTKDLILICLEHAQGSLEMIPKLIDQMVELKWLSLQTLVEVVEDIVGSVEELATELDLPKLGDALSVFIAKLVEQRIFTTSAVKLLASKHADAAESVKAIYADALAFTSNHHLLSGKCIPCGGHHSNDVLKAQFKLILQEFIISNDKKSAEQRLSELKVPHFNHEFVYQSGVMALEQMHDQLMVNLVELIKHLTTNGTLADSCIVKGFTRLYSALPDLFLDLPAAYALADRWVEKSKEAGYITEELANKCPKGTIRSRSRTLSQGPDGKLSCMDEDVKELELSNGVGLQNGQCTETDGQDSDD